MKQKRISLLLLAICILFGVCILVAGIIQTYKGNEKTKNYQEVEGQFVSYGDYANDEEKKTYFLTYSYHIDGQEYTVSTEYGTEIIPEKNSTRVIKYNPDNPKEAIIQGASNATFLILLGILFTFVPLFILLVMLYTMGYFQNTLTSIIDIGIGILFIGVGIGTMYMIAGGVSIEHLVKLFSSTGSILTIIPILFILVGIFQLVKILFFKFYHKKKENL